MFWKDKAENQIGDKEALLQDVMRMTGCMYLSDIKNSIYRMSVMRALYRIRPEEYSLEAWGELILYLSEKKKKVSVQEEARMYLIEYLCGNL